MLPNLAILSFLSRLSLSQFVSAAGAVALCLWVDPFTREGETLLIVLGFVVFEALQRPLKRQKKDAPQSGQDDTPDAVAE